MCVHVRTLIMRLVVPSGCPLGHEALSRNGHHGQDDTSGAYLEVPAPMLHQCHNLCVSSKA